MEINIDKEIDNHRCPTICLCTVATTCYEPIEREQRCYRCWKAYCQEHNITIIYDNIYRPCGPVGELATSDL